MTGKTGIHCNAHRTWPSRQSRPRWRCCRSCCMRFQPGRRCTCRLPYCSPSRTLQSRDTYPLCVCYTLMLCGEVGPACCFYELHCYLQSNANRCKMAAFKPLQLPQTPPHEPVPLFQMPLAPQLLQISPLKHWTQAPSAGLNPFLHTAVEHQWIPAGNQANSGRIVWTA